MGVIDLTTRRFERLEKAQRETNDRLGRIEDSLGRVVGVLEVHTEALYGIAERVDRATERVDRLSDRVDLMTAAIARGRTQDLERFTRIERRTTALESQRARPRRKPH